jgi:hypothetical protein
MYNAAIVGLSENIKQGKEYWKNVILGKPVTL